MQILMLDPDTQAQLRMLEASDALLMANQAFMAGMLAKSLIQNDALAQVKFMDANGVLSEMRLADALSSPAKQVSLKMQALDPMQAQASSFMQAVA